MIELVWWAGRILVLGALLAYLWAVAGRLRAGVAQEVPGGAGESPHRADAAAARLELVQDNAADGVLLGRDGRRVGLRQEVPLGDEVTLGRGPENLLVIGDRFTSGRHARLFLRDGRYWVEDLGSKNGTLLNGHRVAGAQRVVAGDRITVGSCTFRFMG